MKKKDTMFDDFEKAQMGDEYEHEAKDSVLDKITPRTKHKAAEKASKTEGTTIKAETNKVVATVPEVTNVPPVVQGEPKTFEAGPLERLMDSAVKRRDERLEHRNKLVESLYQQLHRLAEGERLTYAELSENAGIDVRFSGRRMLMDARRRLEDNAKGRVFSPAKFHTSTGDGFLLSEQRGLVRVTADAEMLEKGRFWIREGLRKLKRSLRYLELTDKYRLNEEDRERLIRSSMAVESALTFLDESVTGKSSTE